MNSELLQFVMFGGPPLPYENSATEPSEPGNNTGRPQRPAFRSVNLSRP